MPELPEVETITGELRSALPANTLIKKVDVFWERSVAQPDATRFCQKLSGQNIQQIYRRGKFIVFVLTDYSLLVHLRMTGKFFMDQPSAPVTSHERIRLTLADGRVLRYEDQRKFGKWYLLTNLDEYLTKLGVEPLENNFTIELLSGFLEGRKTSIKPFLLNQSYIVGLGNIYVDEALWEAKIHPARSAGSLKKIEIKRLFHSIQTVLQRGIENMGTTLGNHQANYFSVSGRRGDNQHQLRVFRRDGLPCPRCQATIVRITLAQRGTHFCPECQRLD